MKTFLSATLSLIIIVILIFGGTWFVSVKAFIWPASLTAGSYDSLRAERDALKAELAKLASFKESVMHFNAETIYALVYGTDPFSMPKAIMVTAGINAGVSGKMPVLADGFFAGTVVEIARHSSLVQTIFDSALEMPVTIGKTSRGLLKGGARPEITLIAAEARVASGDQVYTASKDFPLGIPLGTLGIPSGDAGEAWRSAALTVPYDIRSVTAVEIINNFNR